MSLNTPPPGLPCLRLAMTEGEGARNDIRQYALEQKLSGLHSRLQKLETALLVLYANHIRAEDFIEDDLPHKLCRDAMPQASAHGLSCPSQRSKRTRYPGVDQDGNQEDNASHNIILEEHSAYPLEEPHLICRPGNTVY